MTRLLCICLLCSLLLLPSLAPAQTVSDTADPFPEDAALALSGIVAEMRGWPLTGMPITLMPGGNFQFREPAFRYAGFEVRYVELIDLKFLADNPLHRYMQAVIHFMDESGRLALVQLAAEYALYENEGIMLRNAAVWPLFSPAPRFEMLAVPAATLKAAGPGIAVDFKTLHDFARRNTIRSSTGKDVTFIIFAKDRLAPASKVDFILSGQQREDDPDDSVAEFAATSFDGWTVAMTEGRATLGDPKNMLYAGVYYQQANGDRVLVGSFDTMMTPTPEIEPFSQPWQRTQAGPRGSVASPQPEASQPRHPQASPNGALGGGQMLLNPIFPDHVQTIQLRLQALGYYNGPIDMEYGTSTQDALGNFARQHGLSGNQWSMELQRALFKDSGQ